MAGLKIDDGPLSPTYRFADIPQDRWKQLVREKRNFLATKIRYDCRCLIEFCEEAEVVWRELGYESAADMIRSGYQLDAQQIELAVAWLKINEPAAAIGIDDVKAKVAAARETPLAEHGENQHTERERGGDNITSSNRGTGTSYTLRRLARDAPEMLDRIEAGELSVNQAAIQAGIRRKATPEQVCLKAFGKAEHRLQTLKAIIDTLSNTERIVVQEWLSVAE